jgi:hypothetical protein
VTCYLNFRSNSVGGAVIDPVVLAGDGTADPPNLSVLDWPTVGSLVSGKHVLFAVHGFNVSREHGARSLGQFEAALGPTATEVFMGVLWPGDYWLPVVNYPFEGGVAMDCGRRLALCCAQRFASAQSISFVSHSLGARLVLEAVANLGRQVRVVCLTAGAINQDCLATEYSSAAGNCAAISLLASHSDWVLKVAFRIGDPISDLLHDDHNAFERALGYDGPALPAGPPILSPWQIADGAGYGHGDYLPPGDAVQNSQAAAAARWQAVAAFVGRAFRQQPQAWP